MLTPSQLAAAHFRHYPPLAREVAVQHLALFREMPTIFLALLLRELIAWDWKFPAERNELTRQFNFLNSLSREQRIALFNPFANLKLSPELERADWVNAPTSFSEQLSAHLWATHQIDSFRTAAREFFDKVAAALPEQPPAVHRAAFVSFGHGVRNNSYPLFRKLRRRGAYFPKVTAEDGLKTLVDAVNTRAHTHPESFGHWYISEASTREASAEVVPVSYEALRPLRATIQEKMRELYESASGPEAIRSLLAKMRPEDVGMSEAGNPVLSRFELSLLTEASGTQIYSTTFVQWAVREALRRARPLTLLARFTPRQREHPMNELLTEASSKPELDPQGSLIDADLGAYYTWLNQQRLTGAREATFLAWFEAGTEAVAIGPKFKPGSVSGAPISLADLVNQLT
jgi:hypothetical protein